MSILCLAMGLLLLDGSEDVKAAVKKLGDASGYSWTSTPKTESENARAAGPTEGKVEKDGGTLLSTKAGENTIEAVILGGKVVVKTKDGWKTGEELRPPDGAPQGQRDPAASMARRLRNFKAPAAEAAGLVEKSMDLKAGDEGLISGGLTEEGVKGLLTFGRGGGGNAPTIANPKGTVKFWLKDGALVKYEYNVQAKVTFGEREVNTNRTVTVEIRDAGSTRIEIPEEAKKKLG